MQNLYPNTIYEYWFDKGAGRGWSQTHLFITDNSGKIPTWTSCGVWISRLSDDDSVILTLGDREFTKHGANCGRCALVYQARSFEFEQARERSNLPSRKARRNELEIVDQEVTFTSSR